MIIFIMFTYRWELYIFIMCANSTVDTMSKSIQFSFLNKNKLKTNI